MNACNIQLKMGWECILLVFICRTVFMGRIVLASSTETNLYHYDRDFEPIEFGDMGPPTPFKVIMAASELTGIVGPTNIVVDFDETYAQEYEGVSWGYPTAIAAWNNALDCHMQHYLTHPGVWYDNAGWVKGTEEAYDEWGAYVWYLQNRLTFQTSPTNEYVSGAGVTSQIARVLVGSLGDYCPQATVTEYSPALNTNYPGAGSGTNVIFRADTRAFYKLAIPMFEEVNDGDADGDGIPDYADGFNWDGVSGNDDDQTPGDAFEPWLVTLPLYVNVTQTMIRFDYSASSPTGLVRSGSVSNYTYTPASGTLRLWKKRAHTSRLKAEVSSGGDYIASTNYSASALGASVTDKTVTIYVEGITPGLDQSVSVYFSTNGANWNCMDEADAAVTQIGFIDREPNYSLKYDSGYPESDNFFLRESDDHKDLDIYYQIFPENLPVTNVQIKIYEGTNSGPTTVLEGQKDGGGLFKIGSNLYTNWTPSIICAEDHLGYYRLQLVVYIEGEVSPICQTPIHDADGISSNGWQSPQDCLGIYDLVWRHRPVIYMGANEHVGPPQNPFNNLMIPWMRHKNGPDRMTPDDDVSFLSPPSFNDFGDMTNDFNYENMLLRSGSTTNPYLDMEDAHLQAYVTNACVFHYSPNTEGVLIHTNYAFIQFWMYYPSSHGVYNDWNIGDNELAHEGDWEMCQFTIRLAEPNDTGEKAKWLEPFAATASQHYYGQTILWNRNSNGPATALTWNQNYVSHVTHGNRVNLYIAENAHAVYFRPGIIDSDIFAGCGTQVQYDSNPENGYDWISPNYVTFIPTYFPISGSNIFEWPGHWGQTYNGYPWDFHGPPSCSFRSAGIGDWDSDDPSRVPLTRDPILFHDLCRKTSLQQTLELK